MRRHLTAVLIVGLTAFSPAAPLAGQTPTGGEVRIQGHVLDNESMAPLSGVRVIVTTAGGTRVARVITDQDGNFFFTAAESAGFSFRASRIGYEETETPILWTDDYRVFTVEIRLDPDAVLLAPIEVLARSRDHSSPVLADFQRRVETGLGHYFTRADVERIKPSRVSDLLARVPGIRLESSGAGLRRGVFMSRGGTNCRAQIFIDGMQWTREGMPRAIDDPGFTVDDAVSPGSIQGIEVYQGLSGIPAEFLTPQARCGVVAIWTRR